MGRLSRYLSKNKMVKVKVFWVAIIMTTIWASIILIDNRTSVSCFTNDFVNWTDWTPLQTGIAFVLASVFAAIGILINGRHKLATIILMLPETLALGMTSAFAIQYMSRHNAPIGCDTYAGLYVMAFSPVILVSIAYWVGFVLYHRNLGRG